MIADFLILFAAIMIGLRKPFFNIFDRLLANDRKVSKNQILYLFAYVITANLIGLSMISYGLLYLISSLLALIGQQFTIQSGAPLIKAVIFAFILLLHIVFIVLPLLKKIKQIKSQED